LDKTAGEKEKAVGQFFIEKIPMQEREEILKDASNLIAEHNKSSKEFVERAKKAKGGYVPTLKQYYSLAALMHYYHANALEGLKVMTESIFDLYDELAENLNKLEKDVRSIKNTGAELSVVKTDLEKVKKTVKNPIEKISKYIEESETVEARKKKIEDELLDWALRSH
jgi:DNA repair exonuclease SbcCD ATPase subunit